MCNYVWQSHNKIIFFHFRGKSHQHVVQLLRGSGSHPSLLVQWRPTSALKHQTSVPSIAGSSRSSQHSVTFENERPATISRCSSVSSRAFSPRNNLNGSSVNRTDVRMLSRQFQLQVSFLSSFTMGWQNTDKLLIRPRKDLSRILQESACQLQVLTTILLRKSVQECQ